MTSVGYGIIAAKAGLRPGATQPVWRPHPQSCCNGPGCRFGHTPSRCGHSFSASGAPVFNRKTAAKSIIGCSLSITPVHVGGSRGSTRPPSPGTLCLWTHPGPTRFPALVTTQLGVRSSCLGPHTASRPALRFLFVARLGGFRRGDEPVPSGEVTLVEHEYYLDMRELAAGVDS